VDKTLQVTNMDELRTFELDEPRIAQALTFGRAATIRAVTGPIWVTVEGEADDVWLEAGQQIKVARGKRVWLSADVDGARFTVRAHRPRVGVERWTRVLATLAARLTRTVPTRSA
jgi:hypothetical protein